MKIAIVGAGNVGGTLAKRWGGLGHTIYLGVRDPRGAEALNLAKSIGMQASPHLPSDAAAQADVIVLSVPWSAAREAVESLGDLKGKILIDCTNPLKKDLSGLEVGHTSSGAELVRGWARGAKVFKAFNTVGFNIMEDPVLEGGKAVMFYCGDGQKERETVHELVVALGFEALDVGSIESARLLEPWALLWIQSAYVHGLGRDFGFGILRRKEK